MKLKIILLASFFMTADCLFQPSAQAQRGRSSSSVRETTNAFIGGARAEDALAEKQLFDLGCSKVAVQSGQISCPSIVAYGLCEGHRKEGKIAAKACVAPGLDIALFHKLEANLVDLDCRRLGGRAGEYYCESWAGGELCESNLATNKGLITKCLTPKTTLGLSYQNSFGREPTTQEVSYWEGQIKLHKYGYKELMQRHSQWLKTSDAAPERNAMMSRGFKEVYGRLPSAGEIEEMNKLFGEGGSNYETMRTTLTPFMLGNNPGGSITLPQEVTKMIERAFHIAKRPQPLDIQVQVWVLKAKSQKLTFKQVLEMLKK